MFSQANSNHSFLEMSSHSKQIGLAICSRSSQLAASSSKESRQSKKKLLRFLMSIRCLPYHGVRFSNFAQVVEAEQNPYSLLVSIFVLVDDVSWRQYISHLEMLIRKFSSLVNCSHGKILSELSLQSMQENRQHFQGYLLQQRLQSMLYLSNKQFQDHLLLLIHNIVSYNQRYNVVDERSLSTHLVHRHSYEKSIREEVLWMLTRISLSHEAVIKLIKKYTLRREIVPLLPLLTILANFIYEQPPQIVSQLISAENFQAILGDGLSFQHYQINREATLICNNTIFKSAQCARFMLQQTKLIEAVCSFDNQQTKVFKQMLQSLSN